MATATLSPSGYRIRKWTWEGAVEATSLPMEAGTDFYGQRMSLIKFTAPSDFEGAEIHAAELSWTVGYYTSYSESGFTILGVPANAVPFASQLFPASAYNFSSMPLGTEQRVVQDENYYGADPYHGMIAASGTALTYHLQAMLAQAMAAGRFAGGEIQLHWVVNSYYSDYYQFTSGTPSLYLSYTPAPLLLGVPLASVGVGATITGTVTRSGSTSGDLVVTISQTGTNRLTLPATVTILDGQSSQTFAITGAAYGSETLTATAGSDSFSRTITVAPVGLGDEYLWICPSLDEEGNGTTTATDLSGNNRNGTLTDMDAATDWVADTAEGGIRALDFDGSDRVLLGDVSASQWTFATWVKVDSFGGAYKRLFGQAGFRVDIAHDPSGRLAVFTHVWHTFGSAVPTGTWVHYVVTYDGTSLRAYLDGSQIGSTVADGRSMVGASRLGDYVSGPTGGDGNQLDGRLDDTRIFARVITSAERTHLASARAVTGGPPVDALTLDTVTRSIGSGLSANYAIDAATWDAVTRSVASGLAAGLSYDAATRDAVTRSLGSGLIADYEIEAVIGDAISRSIGSGLSADYEIDAATWDAVTRSISSGLSAGFAYDAVTRDAITRSLGSGFSADFEIDAATLNAVTRSIASGLSAGLSYDASTRNAVTRSIASGLSAGLSFDAVTRDAITRSIGSGIVARLLRRRSGLFPNQLFPNDLLGSK